jgi:hypothetical protein
MKTRTDLLNHLAEKYQLKRYLEIGVQVPELNFDRIKCEYKVGVDPDPKAKATFQMTSDEYFNKAWMSPDSFLSDEDKFSLIFIDGLHTAEQVKKDFENALKILSPNGFIVLHDCNPEKEEHTIVPRPTQRGHWNGDIYKFAVKIIGSITVDIDNGCLVWRNNYGGTIIYAESFLNEYKPVNWPEFNSRRKELLNLITWDEFIAIGSHVQ